jgi:hypothetical protein
MADEIVFLADSSVPFIIWETALELLWTKAGRSAAGIC